ncbi:MAG: hypothetical protein DMF64_00350 [Acidobacteria bacterium]|nr:MAG: hypothetical protein DMF64_00350 [Acidobacteriota bacterium]
MNKLRFTLRFLAAVTFVLAVTSLAHAQATRTWVSGVGDDANPCSRTAPCKTFAGAISKTFINGEIDCLDEGGFGVVTITKSITIEGTFGGGFGSVLSSGSPTAVLINLTSGTTNDPLQTVRLRNIAITGTGASGTVGTRTGTNGVRILSAFNVYIENCVITDLSNRGISDERTTTGSLYITDTIVRNCAQSGIVVIPGGGASVKASIDHTRSEGNGSSGYVAEGNTNVTVSNSVAAGNAGGGFVSEQATGTTKLNLESCTSVNNGSGIIAGTGSSDTVCSNCNIFNNGIGLNFSGGTIHSYGNNKVSGNAGGGTSNGPFTAGGPTQQ